MANRDCPLKLECVNGGNCPQAQIAFDTIDSYPAQMVDRTVPLPEGGTGLYEGYLTRHQFLELSSGSDTANDWPYPVCDASGAMNEYGTMSERSQAWLSRFTQLIIGNTWPTTLRDAADEFPGAPWARAFREEYDRVQNPQPIEDKPQLIEEPSSPKSLGARIITALAGTI